MWNRNRRQSRFANTFGTLLFVSIMALGLALLNAPASAQLQTCGPRDDVVALLGKNFSEAQTAVGLGTDGAVVEVFSTADGASWTILVTRADGTSCVAASGQQWIRAIPAAGPIS